MLTSKKEIFNQKYISVADLWKCEIDNEISPYGYLSFCSDEAFSAYGTNLPSDYEGNLRVGLKAGLALKLCEISEEYSANYLNIATINGPKASEIGPQHLGFPEVDGPAIYATRYFKIVFNNIISQSVLSLTVPDQSQLSLWILDLMLRSKLGKSKTSQLSDTERPYLLLMVLCALLAHDLQSAKTIFAWLKTGRRYSKHYAAIKSMIDHAEQETIDGKTRVRIVQPEGVDAFFRLYNWYRCPDTNGFYAAMYPEGQPKGEDFVLTDGTMICSYLLTWIYLQCVVDEAQTQTDWDTLKYFMRS